MKRSGSRRSRWTAITCALTALSLAACDASKREAGEELPDGEREEDQTLPQGSAPGSESGSTSIAAPADTIHVALTDFAIEMPSTLPAGAVAFHVQNSGGTAHNFEIEGEGMEESLSEDLPPGETSVLVVDLKPGTYEVYCPVSDHDDRGMRLKITVQ